MAKKSIILEFDFKEEGSPPDLFISDDGFDGDLNEIAKRIISVAAVLADQVEAADENTGTVTE